PRLSPRCHLSIVSCPGPSSSTLFPYTTLFRSHSAEALNGAIAVLVAQIVLGVAITILTIFTLGLASFMYPLVGVPQGEDRQDREDRKSTRLNSSHVSISYAVFCLKKKR